MDSVALKVSKRGENESAQDIRDEGFIPGICYGAGKENVAFKVEYQTFRKLYNKAGESTVIDLDVDGEKHKVLVHDLQYDPVYGTASHIDLIFIDMNKPVTTHVHLDFEGESPAVKNEGGILTKSLTELEIKCLPANLPHDIKVDISGLVDFHTVIHVSDIPAPEGVEILTDAELTVATVSAPRVEEEPELSPEEMEAAAVAEAAGEDGEEGEEGGESEGGEE